MYMKLPNTNAANHRKEVPDSSLVNQDAHSWLSQKKNVSCLRCNSSVLSSSFLLLIFACGSKINFSLAAAQVSQPKYNVRKPPGKSD